MGTMSGHGKIEIAPLFELIERNGGECSFSDGLKALNQLGMSESQARDMLWRLLSDGSIEFTVERHLKVPTTSEFERAAG